MNAHLMGLFPQSQQTTETGLYKDKPCDTYTGYLKKHLARQAGVDHGVWPNVSGFLDPFCLHWKRSIKTRRNDELFNLFHLRYL